MTAPHRLIRSWFRAGGRVACMLLVPWSMVHAEKTIHEQVGADPQGSVEIVNVAGSVDLAGWDQPQIEVTGTAGDQVDRVDVTSNGPHALVHVVDGSRSGWGSGGGAHLVIHVPRHSSISASLVSADIHLQNLQGNVALQTVSGDIDGEVGGDLRANAISGSVHVAAPAAKMIEVKTVSGDIKISGGSGDAEITTISGSAQVDLATLQRGRFKSVSGDMTAAFALGTGGQVDGESVSGDLHLNFSALPAADFDVQSFSGDISNCFGPRPVESRYGPGSRLTFKNGDGRVRIETKSGDVRLCTRDAHGGPAAAAPHPAG